MDSDLDNDIMFLTQNKFRSSSESETESESAANTTMNMKDKKYQPVVSDVSDDEFIAATLAAEEVHKAEKSSDKKSRFGKPKGDEEMKSVVRRRLADSTERKIKWAVDLFINWQLERNRTAVEDPSLNISPINVQLDDMTKDELNYSISRFLCEVKKQNGDDYPGETLHELVICLQLHFELQGVGYKFLSDTQFMELRNTLDRMMQERAKDGKSRRKQAQEITVEEEEILWRSDILGSKNPTQLLNTVVYMIGLNFALRGGQEHRDLRFDNPQIELLTDENGSAFLRYNEDMSKSNQGGLKHRKVKPKVVDAYENKKDRQRCIVTLYQKYLYHCPAQRPSAFYLRPLAKPRGNIWYAAQPLGRHKLAQVVATICSQGGLTGHRTNHSLRASAASRMYRENVDEQLICEITGHRSAAVRNYKRTSATLKRQVNAVVQGHDMHTSAPSTSTCRPTLQTTTSESDPNKRHITLTLNLNL